MKRYTPKKTGKAAAKKKPAMKKVAKMSTPLDKARKAAGKLGGGSGVAVKAIDKHKKALQKILDEMG